MLTQCGEDYPTWQSPHLLIRPLHTRRTRHSLASPSYRQPTRQSRQSPSFRQQAPLCPNKLRPCLSRLTSMKRRICQTGCCRPLLTSFRKSQPALVGGLVVGAGPVSTKAEQADPRRLWWLARPRFIIFSRKRQKSRAFCRSTVLYAGQRQPLPLYTSRARRSLGARFLTAAR
jgi:hypothetical protein